MSNDVKSHITFLDGVDGRMWFIVKGFKFIPLSTEEMKDLLKQLEIQRDLDWLSPF